MMVHVHCCPAGTILIDNHFLLHVWKGAYTIGVLMCTLPRASSHVPSCMCTVDWASPILQLTTTLFCFLVNTNQEMENGESLQNIMECLLFLWVVSHQQLTPIHTQYSCIDTHPSIPRYPSRQMLPYTTLLTTILLTTILLTTILLTTTVENNNNTLLPNQLAKFHTERGTGIPPQGNLKIMMS